MEVELAPKIIGRLRQTQRAKRLMDNLVIAGTIFLALVLIAAGLANWLIGRENQNLDRRIQAVKKEIEAKAKVETQQVYLASKLISFGGLIKTQKVHQDVAETVFNLVPSGTSVKGFAVTPTGAISLSGTVSGWPLLTRLLANLKGKTTPLLVTDSKIDQLNFTADGTINFTVEIKLGVPQ